VDADTARLVGVDTVEIGHHGVLRCSDAVDVECLEALGDPGPLAAEVRGRVGRFVDQHDAAIGDEIEQLVVASRDRSGGPPEIGAPKVKLSDPIRRFLPEWRHVKVSVERPDGSVDLVHTEQPISAKHALMHMTGMGTGPP